MKKRDVTWKKKSFLRPRCEIAVKNLPSPLGEPMFHKYIKMQRKPMPPTLVGEFIPWNGIAFSKLASWSKDPEIHSKATIFFASPFCEFILTFKTMHTVKYTKTNMTNLIWTQQIQKLQTFIFFILSWFLRSGKTFQSH